MVPYVHFLHRYAETALKELPQFGAETLDPEWRLLLACASPHVDQTRLLDLLPPATRWPELLSFAQQHGVLALLARRLLDCPPGAIPEEICKQLRERLRAQFCFALSLSAELFHILNDFSAAGLEALLVKGPVLSTQAYGDPGLRQYADLDLVVRHRDILRVSRLLLDAGYRSSVSIAAIQAGKIPGEYVFQWPETTRIVELHTERTFRYHPRPLSIEKLFARRILVTVDAHEVPALSVEDELVLICIHGAKHFWGRLLWVADVAALVSRQTSLDWDRTLQVAREVGAERMLCVGLRLAADLLGAKLPEKMLRTVEGDGATRQLASQILRRLPEAGNSPVSLLRRAAFRMRVRGGPLSGMAYLLRLSFSPTEEDWMVGQGERRSWLFDALHRPLRLIRKYNAGNGKN